MNNTFIKSLLIVAAQLATIPFLSAQGCSDAGLCTVPGYKPNPKLEFGTDRQELRAGLSMGTADYNILAFGGHFTYYRQVGQNFRVESRLTFLSQSGNDIGVSGVGDVFLNLNYKVSSKFSIMAGSKIPLTKADRVLDSLPLPMDYQSSLGTFDLLVGVNYTAEKWQWTLGYQQPLSQNENAFFPDLYLIGDPLRKFQATNQFERQSDVLMRISYIYRFSEKMSISPSLLPIYHLGEDRFTNMDDVVEDISGSDGLTLNANFYYSILLNPTSLLEFNLGFPMIVREARPDGLTRSFVLAVDYGIRF